KSPADWYCLGRYHLMAGELGGADSAFTKALTLAPTCKEDIGLYRRQAWVPVFNTAAAAWQAGNTDSAIAEFRRANQIYQAEPLGFIYLANLFVSRREPDSALKRTDVAKYHTDSLVYATRMDSAAKYFRLAVSAASDPKYAKDRREASLNVARVYHSEKPHDEAAAAYKEFLRAYPTDVHAMADPLYRLGVQTYEAGLAKSPCHRDALYNMTGISFMLNDTAKVLPLAQRLFAVDPMNRLTLAKLAGAWQLAGKKDSALYYITLADSLPVEVTVGTFTTNEQGAALEGLFTNFHSKPSPPIKLTFELVDGKGNVVASVPQDVPAVDPGANQSFKLKTGQPGIVAWRYKRS